MVRNWLKELRNKQGLTAKALAGKLGVSLRVVFAWEAGEKTPGGANLVALARELGPDVFSKMSTEGTAAWNIDKN